MFTILGFIILLFIIYWCLQTLWEHGYIRGHYDDIDEYYAYLQSDKRFKFFRKIIKEKKFNSDIKE